MRERRSVPGILGPNGTPRERRVGEKCRPRDEQASHPKEEDPQGTSDHAATLLGAEGTGTSVGGSGFFTTGIALSWVDMVGAGSERIGRTALYVWPLHVAKKW